MYKILAVTNRSICNTDFLKRIEEIASSNVTGIILREKDLEEDDYYELAKQVVKICDRYQVPCILHTYVDVARKLGVMNIHLPLNQAKQLVNIDKANKDYVGVEHTNKLSEFKLIGMSVHSKEEAIEAERLGATYITAGHIFETDCKKGLPPRGLTYLHEICEAVTIPIYGIGGITIENATSVIDQGASGVCIMSGFMRGTVSMDRL